MCARLFLKHCEVLIPASYKGIDFAAIKSQAEYSLFPKIHAGIAQLVEQRIRNAKVVGSIPISGTNLFLK
ncbi:MAG: hypothetical protein RLY18_553 [Pseudomonadota bacterium]